MKYIFLIILGFVFLVSCSTPTKEINELSTQNGPFQVVENQDSIKIYHQEKLFTGTAIQYLNKTQILLKVEYSKGLINGKLLAPIGMDIIDYYEYRQLNILSINDEFLTIILNNINPDKHNLYQLILKNNHL